MDQPPPLPEQPPEALAPPATSLPARLVNVFAAPGDVFEEVKSRSVSTANWLVPAVVFIVLCWVGGMLLFSQGSINQQLSDIASKAVDKQIEKGKMTDQQAEAARQAADKYGTLGAKISAGVVPVLVAVLSPFWWGLILWLGSKVLRGGTNYMKAVEVAGLANMINVLAVVVETLLKLSLGNFFATPSLMLLVKDFDPQSPTYGLLAVVNVMVFWALAVRSVGLARLTGSSFGKAAVWVFGIWAAYTGLFVGAGFALQAAFNR